MITLTTFNEHGQLPQIINAYNIITNNETKQHTKNSNYKKTNNPKTKTHEACKDKHAQNER